MNADLEDAPIEIPDWEIISIDPLDEESADDALPDWRDWQGDESQCFTVLRIDESLSLLDISPDLDSVLVSVMSHLQDRVTDEANRPWPEHRMPDGRTVVLEPGLDENSHDCWQVDGHPVARIGMLRELRAPKE